MSEASDSICPVDLSDRDREFGSDGLRVIQVDIDDPRLVPFVKSHPSCTVYHHPAWLRTLRAEYDRELLILGCEDQNSGLHGIFPLMYTRGFPLSLGSALAKARLSSLPRTPIAGPLCTNAEVARLLLRAAMARVSDRTKIRLQVKTEGPVLEGLTEDLSGAFWRHSYVLALPEDPAQIRIGDSSKERSRISWSVRKARRLGLQVRIATSDEFLAKWYPLYLKTMRRVTVPPRPERFFHAMWKYLQPLGLMKAMLVERQVNGKSELIAGSIFLMFGKRASYAFTACPAEYFALRPHDLIQWEAIHFAVQNGFREYDLGEVAGDSAHLASFKAKWGAEERPLYRYYYPHVNAKHAVSSKLSMQQRLLQKVWSRLPLGLTAYVGERVYKYL